MPDITITPGTFNPPGTLAVVHGLIEFPKTPVQQVRRPALQYNSRWVEPAAVELEQNIEFTLWNPIYFAAAGPRVGSATTFTVTGARYVPDGTYTDDYGSGDFYGDYLPFEEVGDYVPVDDTPGFWGGNEFGETATSYINYTYPIQITLVGCTDGATYEVTGRYPGQDDYAPLSNEGGGVWTAVAEGVQSVAWTLPEGGPATAPPSSLSQWGEFQLFRNGEIYDYLYFDAGSITQMVFTDVGEWNPELYGEVDSPTLQGINMVLYGPEASALATSAPAIVPGCYGLSQWQRQSHAHQGNLTIA